MDADTQILFDNLTTTRAHLRCVFGINKYHGTPSFFRFGDCVLYELSPGEFSQGVTVLYRGAAECQRRHN